MALPIQAGDSWDVLKEIHPGDLIESDEIYCEIYSNQQSLSFSHVSETSRSVRDDRCKSPRFVRRCGTFASSEGDMTYAIVNQQVRSL